jgi:hypothetical protein
MEVLIILGWIPVSVLVGFIAKERGRSMIGWSLVSIVVSPLLAFVALAVVPDKS